MTTSMRSYAYMIYIFLAHCIILHCISCKIIMVFYIRYTNKFIAQACGMPYLELTTRLCCAMNFYMKHVCSSNFLFGFI